MATRKFYAYYIEGNKIGLAQKETDTTSTDLRSEDYGQYKSPQEAISDGLEIKYTYIPEYNIDETEDVGTQIDTYVSLDGLLKIIDQGDNDYSASPESLSDGSYIVLENAGKFNGLHKVKAAGVGYITLYTKFSGSATVQKAFEETVNLYYNVSVMVDESFEIDLPRYLNNALVLYLKSRKAEDEGNMEMKEYYSREFKRQVEKHSGGKISTTHRIQGFGMMNVKL
jgi:hypothetical protein